MENILDSYKKIVHKAVDLGLLSEENKLFYLSSIDQSAPISSNLDGSDLPLQSPQPTRRDLRYSCKQSINGFRTKQPDFCRAHAMSTAIDDTLSTSLENYSDFFEMKSLTASDSELDYYHHHHQQHYYHQQCECCSRHRPFPTKPISRRNEIVDFRIPIYVGIGKKKKSRKKPMQKSCRWAGFKGFSSEDLSHDERNTFTKRHFRNKKYESEKAERKSGAVETAMSSHKNALEKDLVVCDILYDEQNDECNDFTSTESNESPRQVGSATEKARGDGLREHHQPTLSKELNPHQQLDIPPSPSNSKCNDIVRSEVSNNHTDTVRGNNDRFEMSATSGGGGGGSDYCKMKEVLVLNSAEEATEPKEKLLQVNIFCQLVPNAVSNVADQKEDVPNTDCDLKSDPTSPTTEASKTEKNKGSTKEKIRRKRPLNMLSKMFSRIKLPSRFNK